MKFGRNLPRNQVPEWASEYINYKGLKGLIKSAADEVKAGGEPDLAGFFFALDRNLETVNEFYNKKYADYNRRLKLLGDRYANGQSFPATMDKTELDDLIAALLELRSQLRKLQWYGEVNRRGFIKITKKMDKKVPVASAQERYLPVRVDPRPFATNFKLGQDMNVVNTWLSKLSDVKPVDDASSMHSSISSSRPWMTQIPKELMDSFEQAIVADSSKDLVSTLGETLEYQRAQNGGFQRLLLSFLQRAIQLRSRKCVVELLKRVDTLDEDDDINERNCIHRLVIGSGRTRSTKASHNLEESPDIKADSIAPAEAPILELTSYGVKEIDSSRLEDGTDDTAEFLTFFLEYLSDPQKASLQAKDTFGRMPLHYAAKYGFVVVCQVIVHKMLAWNQLNLTDGPDSTTWQDSEGNTPLLLSVIGGWRLTTETLLNATIGQWKQGHASWDRANSLLAIATKADFFNIVAILAKGGANVNYQDEQGETALHVAARFGNIDCVKALLAGSKDPKETLEIAERTYGWTPLLVASVDGQLQIVQFLVEAGANVNREDISGWTSKEHAALRGHMFIAEFIAKHTQETPMSGCTGLGISARTSINERASHAILKDTAQQTLPSAKSFGHRYLTNECMVLVSLGSMDARKNVKPVSLDHIPMAEAHATQLDTALSVIISANGATGEPSIFDLPVQDSINTEPVAFHAKDVTKVRIMFDIVPTYAGSSDQVVGRGVAILSTIKTSIGAKRTNLQGDISIPIVAAKTLEIIGTVNFNFIIVTPFSHPNMSISESGTYWKSLSAPVLIGHRGLGKNVDKHRSLQLGENTMQSFISAANLGASYVEFDVQLTKDHVPVIYHDFLVSETGIDAPVHSLTLEQFLHVQDGNTPRASKPSSPTPPVKSERLLANGNAPYDPPRLRNRASSLGSSSPASQEMSFMAERMKHTRDYKLKGYKGNSRGNFIASPFTTLQEMLTKLPVNIGFNIEMKYPMLFETVEQEMDSYAVELNSFVDTVLKMVYDYGGMRNIIFSSFHPDICLLFSLKQPSMPILFLTDAGTSDVGDVRASSLQEAIRFATRWNLLGIVAACDPFVMCPRLVRVVKESGLVCVSYGTMNNEPQFVRRQVEMGIDAVIVDSVLKIRKGLTADEEARKEAMKENGINGVNMKVAAT